MVDTLVRPASDKTEEVTRLPSLPVAAAFNVVKALDTRIPAPVGGAVTSGVVVIVLVSHVPVAAKAIPLASKVAANIVVVDFIASPTSVN